MAVQQHAKLKLGIHVQVVIAPLQTHELICEEMASFMALWPHLIVMMEIMMIMTAVAQCVQLNLTLNEQLVLLQPLVLVLRSVVTV